MKYNSVKKQSQVNLWHIDSKNAIKHFEVQKCTHKCIFGCKNALFYLQNCNFCINKKQITNYFDNSI